MKLAFIRLSMYFNRDVCTIQQVADNISCTVQEVLELDNTTADLSSIDYKLGMLERDIVQAKIDGAGKIQYWKGVLSNV